MEIYHKEEMTLLICEQWELIACLEETALSNRERQSLRQQLAKNVHQMARLVDRYQNPFIIFQYRGENYERYSDVIKANHFEWPQADELIRKVFALRYTNTLQVIEVQKPLDHALDFAFARINSFV